MNTKLTKAQEELLLEIAAEPHHVSESYRPLQELIAKGLIEKRPGKYSDIFYATEAGLRVRAELSA